MRRFFFSPEFLDTDGAGNRLAVTPPDNFNNFFQKFVLPNSMKIRLLITNHVVYYRM